MPKSQIIHPFPEIFTNNEGAQPPEKKMSNFLFKLLFFVSKSQKPHEKMNKCFLFCFKKSKTS